WGTCQSNNTQTRTVLTSSPAVCTGGSPVTTQACTYVPPVTACTSFTYSAWGTCQSNNTQTRTVLTSSPAGCTGGSPVITQVCNYVPPAPPPVTDTIPVPASEETFRYDSSAAPVLALDPSDAKPIGVGPVVTGENKVDLKLKVGPFESPVDISFMIYAPHVTPEDVYFMTSDNELKRVSDAVEEETASDFQVNREYGGSKKKVKLSKIVLWKKGVTELDETLYTGKASNIAPGTYTLVLVAQSPDEEENYYRWVTTLNVPKFKGRDDD
ncbi:MAG: hypothetical protein HZB33_05650, partial [Nitrospirae bacterium]|nr:hypothetical protein [Nitrospirota bacterium]